MGKGKKEHYDRTTEKKGLSQARNLGTDRVIKKVKQHAEITGHKVLVNFIPTWELGRSRIWVSENWGDTIPLKNGPQGNLVPLLQAVVSQHNNSNPAVGDGGQVRAVEEDLPDSHDMTRRPPANPGNKKEKQKMRKVCANCFTVKGSKMDTFPDEPWLRCGVSGCSKLNVHSKCHGIKLINGQQKSVTDFCKLYVRCQGHFQEIVNDEEESDEDFEAIGTVKKKYKKMHAKKVQTPGSFIDSSPDEDLQSPAKKKNVANTKKKDSSAAALLVSSSSSKDLKKPSKKKYRDASIISFSQNNNKTSIGNIFQTPSSVKSHNSTKKPSAYENMFPNFDLEKSMLVEEPVAASVKEDQERYRQFITLRHKCSLEMDQAQSVNFDVIRSYFVKAERKNPFSNAEIETYIDKIAYENKVMWSDDMVYII